jgi:hypothetical protein
MQNQALAKFVCHNLCCLIQSIEELGNRPDGQRRSSLAIAIGAAKCDMKHRKTRIVLLIAYVLVFVPLIAFWARSYWWRYSVSRRSGYTDSITVWVGSGQIRVGKLINIGYHRFGDGNWAYSREPADRRSKFLNAWEVTDNLHYGFAIEYSKNWYYSVYFPYWFFMTVACALAAALWALAGWVKRRFSLRTLFIALTIIAITLGIIAAQ